MRLSDIQIGEITTVVKVPKKYRRWCKKGGQYPIVGINNKHVWIKLSDACHAYNSILLPPSHLTQTNTL